MIRIIAVVTLIAAAAAGGFLLWQRYQAPAPAAPSMEDEMTAILGNIDPVGFDEPRRGVTVTRDDAGGAVFTLGQGSAVRVRPPEGYALAERFAILTPMSAGFFLEDGEGGAVYASFDDKQEDREPPDRATAERDYGQAETTFAEAGAIPTPQGRAVIAEVASDADGLYYCLDLPSDQRFHYAARYVGRLFVQTLSVGRCLDDLTPLKARLDLAAAALAANR